MCGFMVFANHQVGKALGRACCLEAHGRRGRGDGCGVVRGRGGSQVWVLWLSVWGGMGSQGEQEDEGWYGEEVEKGNGGRGGDARKSAAWRRGGGEVR